MENTNKKVTGVGPTLDKMQYELMILEEATCDCPNRDEIDNSLKVLNELVESLVSQLQKDAPGTITRDSFEYLCDTVVEHANLYKMFGHGVKNRTDDEKIYSVKDIKREINDLKTISKFFV